MMKCFVTLLLWLVVHSLGQQPQPIIPSSFKLVLQWPNTFCRVDHQTGVSPCSKQIPQRFTIHGLWAFDSHGKSIGHCTDGEELQGPEQLNANLIPKLQFAWPNLLGDEFAFWSEEWNKHGRCLSGMTPDKYFRDSINLMNEIGDLVEILKSEGLVPHGSNPYDREQFPTAIEAYHQLVTEIRCRKHSPTKSQIYEIYFCATVHGKLTNCTMNNQGSKTARYNAGDCKSDVLFPLKPPAPPSPPPSFHASSRAIYSALTFSLYFLMMG